ncbi:MAG TPA: hypothetical protein VKO35_11950, partial [Acidimicrobiia bacterium]|nr:hypothetical protein [Acidimicrobiia bacterium]
RSPQAVEVRPGVMKLLHDLVVEGAWMKTDPEVVAAASGLARSYAEYHLERRLRAVAAGAALVRKP